MYFLPLILWSFVYTRGKKSSVRTLRKIEKQRTTCEFGSRIWWSAQVLIAWCILQLGVLSEILKAKPFKFRIINGNKETYIWIIVMNFLPWVEQTNSQLIELKSFNHHKLHCSNRSQKTKFLKLQLRNQWADSRLQKNVTSSSINHSLFYSPYRNGTC
jgi:hypothetical protein